MKIPHFFIKSKFQRRSGSYRDILTEDILRDVCLKITGCSRYTVEFDDSGYNIGRLATLEHLGQIHYISFSEMEINSRNSSFQSFPSALLRFHKEANPKKTINFFILPPEGGGIETPYFVFMYRLMKTAGTRFLNEDGYLTRSIVPFNSVEDIILHRNSNRTRNRRNNSTYLTVDENGVLQVYGKTYGASKYETTLLCLAISSIAVGDVELYEIQEGNLTALPALSREIIEALGKIKIISSDLSLERAEFENNDSLRSPAYIYNLLDKLGRKKCVLCDCEIPQIIQGAHIWPVSSIKKARNISQDKKLQFAIDGDNGIWLCNNHHKLFDINLFVIAKNGEIKFIPNISEVDKAYIAKITVAHQLHDEILTPNFLVHLEKRNSAIDVCGYKSIV